MRKHADMVHLVTRQAKERPDALFLECEHGVWTFSAFAQDAELLRQQLAEAGIAPGMPVLLEMEDYAPFFIAMFALWMAGAAAVPLNASLPEGGRQKIRDKIRAPFRIRCSTAPDAGRLAFGIERVNPVSDSPALADDICMVLFTSGSTGIPKGVLCSVDMLFGNARAMADMVGITPADKLFINTPAYYTSAICHLLTALAGGGALAAMKGFFFGEDLLDQMARRGCTGFGGAPTHIGRIVDALDDAAPRPALRFLVSSGDHLPVATIEKVRALCPGAALFTVYGLTEVGGRLCVLDPALLPGKAGSAGKPIGGMAVRILRDDLAPAGPMESGEISVSGPMLMPGYFEAPELNARLMGEHGFRTGDYGHFDAEGFLYVEGRADDIFKSGGEKVSTILIERALLAVEAIADAAAIAVDDPFMGKAPVAFVVPHDPVAFDRLKLLEGLKGALPANHIPKKITVLERIPRTGSGKVVRNELRTLSNRS